MGPGLRLKTERADGVAVDVVLPLPEGSDAEKVKPLIEKLMKLGAREDTTDMLVALAMTLTLKTLTARSGTQSLDATQALVETVLDAGRDAETAMNRKIADIIKRQKLAKLAPAATVRQACKLMAERAIGAVLITDESGKLIGIFTERDLVKRVAAPGLDIEKTSLAEVMTKTPETMRPADPAFVALRRMKEGGFRHMPIVDGGKLLGVVSARDFLGAEMKQLEIESAFRSALLAEGFQPNV